MATAEVFGLEDVLSVGGPENRPVVCMESLGFRLSEGTLGSQCFLFCGGGLELGGAEREGVQVPRVGRTGACVLRLFVHIYHSHFGSSRK